MRYDSNTSLSVGSAVAAAAAGEGGGEAGDAIAANSALRNSNAFGDPIVYWRMYFIRDTLMGGGHVYEWMAFRISVVWELPTHAHVSCPSLGLPLRACVRARVYVYGGEGSFFSFLFCLD